MSERSIFSAALDIPDPADRAAYLDRACAGDPALRRHIEELIAAQTGLGSFLAHPPVAAGITDSNEPLTEGPGTRVGPYKLLEQIGEGGFGVVFMAEQTEPVRRKVALKVLKPGMDTRQVVARFEAERQALAIMDHPNIAKVLDGGATPSGRPFFVMELVKGTAITDFCDQHHLTPRQRLELFVSVCQAVQHAHQKGVIHRDLKPSNVLVTVHDTTPVVKVIDFGVAKALGQELTDKTLFTGFAQMVGTPLYMSPEQAGQSGLDADTRSDIYSLGVLLYELLTGTTPFVAERFKKAAYDEIRRIIREEEPPKPSTRLSESKESLASVAAHRQTEPTRLTRLVRGELDWIVMKALEKDRARRYETANGLAADVLRYLRDEPVLACATSAAYRLRKFARRHRGPVWAAAAVAVVLAGGIIGTTWGLFRATVAEADAIAQAKQKETERGKAVAESERATKAERDGRKRLFEAKLAEAKASRRSRESGQRFETWKALTEATELARELALSEEVFLTLRGEAIACLALADIRVVKEWEGFPPGSRGHLAFDADLEHYAHSDDKGNIRIRRVADDRVLALLPGQGLGVLRSGATGPRFSPDGRFLAVANYHHLPGQPTNFQLWDWRRETSVFQPSFPVCERAFAFSSDGRHVALGQPNGTLTLHEVPTGKEVRRINLGSIPWNVAFHPDGSRVADGSVHSREVQVRDVTSGELLQKLPTPDGARSVAWHPDGVLLAAGCDDSQVYLWDTATWQSRVALKGHQSAVHLLAFAPDGDILASSSWDGTTRIWNPWTGRELVHLPGNDSVFFSRDGGRLANQAGSKAALLEVATGRECRTLPAGQATPKEGFRRGGFSPDGRWLALGTDQGVRLWDLVRGKVSAFLPVSTTHDVQFHPSGKELLTSSAPGHAGLFRWPFQAQAGVLKIGPARKLASQGAPVGGFSLDRQGRTLAVFESSREGLVLDLNNATSTVRLLGHEQANGVAISPNGQWVAAGAHEGSGVKVWDARTGKVLDHLVPDERFATVVFSPDSRWLVTGTGAGFDIWETHPVGPWKLGRHIAQKNGGWAAFTPDGNVLAITLSPSVVQLLDIATGQPLARLQSPDPDPIWWLAFSPDGSQLVVTTQAKTIRLWDLRLIREQLQPIGLDWDRPSYTPAPRLGDVQPLRVEVDLGEFQAQRHFESARAHLGANRRAEAVAEYSKGVELAPDDASALNNLAWCLVSVADPPPADVARAIPLAQKAVGLAPKNAIYWNTLGVARCRAGDWAPAIDTLRKAEQLEPDRHLGFNAFFLAMAHWQLGSAEPREQGPTVEVRLQHQREAHEWFDRGVAWMDKNKPQDEELRRFRAEAAKVLGRGQKSD